MKKIFFVLCIATSLVACQKDDKQGVNETSTERINEQKEVLLNELISSEQGWKMVYYPNSNRFGGFTFLMKFDKNGNVTMASDSPLGTSAEQTSLFQIKTAQTIALSFITKNHIHRLADAENPSLRGTGYEGEFEFLFYGKTQDNKLEFRTQRRKSIVYFEKATQNDWETIETLTPRANELALNSFWYSLQITSPEGKSYHSVSVNKRLLKAKNYAESNKQYTIAIAPTFDGFLMNPPLQAHGKQFHKITYDEETKNYIAIDGDVKVELVFSETKTENTISDAYKEISNISSMIFLSNYLARIPQASSEFREMITILGGRFVIPRLQIGFSHSIGNIGQVSVPFPFPEGEARMYSNIRFELKNKRLYITRTGPVSITSRTWSKYPEVTQAVANLVGFFGEVEGEEDAFFVEKLDERVYYNDVEVYVLVSEKYPNVTIPFYVLY